MRKNYIYILGALIGFLFLTICSCQDSKTDDDKHLLHLTKNTLWDNPEFSELEVDKFHDYRDNTLGPELSNYISKLDSNDVDRKESLMYLDSIEKADVPMKGLLLVLLYNDLLCTMSDDEITKDALVSYIDKAYEIAEKYDNIPQSLFFTYWNNAIVLLSNIREDEEVSKQSQKLLRICQEQNIILGSIFSYYAIAYCLIDENDNSMALEQLNEADKLVEKYFPELVGENWKEGDFTASDLLSACISAKLLQLRCSVDAGDTVWVKKNESDLLALADKCVDHTDVGYVLSYMAMYYDLIGDDANYEKMISRLSAYIDKWHIYELSNEYSNYGIICSLYYTARVQHALKQNNTKKALEYVNCMKDYFVESRPDLIAKIYYLQGNYAEAIKYLYKYSDGNKKLLNGHNRHTIQSLSFTVSEYNQQMQMMRQEMEHSKMRTMLIIIVLVLVVALLIVLASFLYRQKKLNAKLNQALAREEMANHAKDIFLKNMNHEVHTPLNHIYGFAQLMADRTMPLSEDEAREMADAICQGSVQLTQILDNVVDVTDKISKLDRLEEVESVLKDIQKEK